MSDLPLLRRAADLVGMLRGDVMFRAAQLCGSAQVLCWQSEALCDRAAVAAAEAQTLIERARSLQRGSTTALSASSGSECRCLIQIKGLWPAPCILGDSGTDMVTLMTEEEFAEELRSLAQEIMRLAGMAVGDPAMARRLSEMASETMKMANDQDVS